MIDDVISRLEKHAVLPAIIIDDAELAEPLAEALIDGGLPVAEVTLRTPASLDAVRRMAAYDGMLVGAGTVMNVQQAEQAVDAGAKFIVSPGMNVDLIRWCQERGLFIIPCACTPAEIMQALHLGLNCVKFFPSEAFGGLPLLKALHGPFPLMRFVPSGGIHLEILPYYLAFRPVMAVGGTWMVKSTWIKEERFEQIQNACESTVAAVREAHRKLALASRSKSI